MSTAPNRAFWTRRRLTITTAVLLVLPAIYVLATGVMAYLDGRGLISRKQTVVLAYPVFFAERQGVFRTLYLEEAVSRYYEWLYKKGLDAQESAKAR